MTTLLVANNGGHVKQLHSWLPRLGLDEDRVWVTVEAAQTTALLAGERVCWVDYPDARDYRALVRHALKTQHLFRRHRIRTAVSTGASLALSVLPQAAARGIDSRYIESATRFEGPSMAGRVLARLPGVRVYTQYEHLTSSRWQYGGSIFDGFSAGPADTGIPTDRPLRVVVTLGSTGAYGFRRLLERLVQVLPPSADVLWQTGSTDTTGLPLIARRAVPADELAAEVAAADVVVAHAGTGSALGALEAGKFPLIVPRRAQFGEHVDDHQQEIARSLGSQGLVLVREADEVSFDDLERAASMRIERRSTPPDFRW